MLQLNRIIFTVFIAFIFCFKLFSQSDYNFDIQYYDGENHYFKFSDVSSDYGLRRLSNTNLYDYHGGVDFAFNGIQGNIIIAQKEYTIDRIDVDSNGLKSIVFTDGTSFRHIFLGTSIPDCNNESVLGGFILIERFCNTDEYIIINTIDNIAYGPNNGTINFAGNNYNIINTIGIGHKVAPIGNSGGYGTHFHLQSSSNINNLNDDVSTNNPLYNLTYERPESVSYSLDVTNLFTNNYLRGYNKHPFKVKVTFNNLEEVPNTATRFINSVFDLENIKLQIKPLLGQYETMETVEESFISIGGAQNSVPLPSYIGVSNDDDNIIGSENKTGIEPFAYSELVTTNQNDFDNYFFADFRPRFSNDNSDAELNEDAKYQDGEYFIRSSLTDIKGNIYESEPFPIIIDNFYPYIVRTLYIYQNDELYRIYWERDGENLIKDGEIGNRIFQSGDVIKVAVRTSEPMNNLSLSILGTSHINMPMEARTTEDISWEVEFEYTGDTGEKLLEFTGIDKNNTPLLNDVQLVVNHKIPNGSGRNSLTPTVGYDRNHKLNESNPCDITASAGNNVTIQNGGSTQLQGSGGTSCSWSPTIGLTNPNSCTTSASPSQTTTYTLTVTENGCTDTDQVTITVDGTTGGNPPTNDDCSDAITLTSNTSCNYINGTVEDATPSFGANLCDGCSCTSPDDYDVYYKFTAIETSHTVTVGNYASNFDAVIELRTACSSGSSNYISCFDPSGAPLSVSETWNGLTIGQTYYIRVFEWGYQQSPPNADTFDICVTHQNNNTDGIDLISDITSVSEGNPNGGDQITVNYSVTNNGDETMTDNTTSALYLSTNQTYGSSDILITGSVYSLTSNLSPNQSINLSPTVTLPNVSDGQYYIISYPDLPELITESDNDNNTDAYAIQIGDVVTNGPNLDVRRAISVPDNGLVPGQEVEMEIRIENDGNEDSNGFDVLVYLDIDDDGNPDSNEVMGEFAFSALDADEDITVFEDFNLPVNIPSEGTYDLYVLADSNNDINETNENDNDKRDSVTIVLVNNDAENDLVVLNETVSSTNVNAGEDIDVTVDHVYLGSSTKDDLPTTGLGYYLSTDCNLSIDDILLDDETSNIGIDDPVEGENETLTIPAGTSTGTYYILFAADFEHVINEGNFEDNNLECIEITVTNNTTPIGDITVIEGSCLPDNIVSNSETYLLTKIGYSGGQIDINSYEVFYYFSNDCILSDDDIFLGDDNASLGSDNIISTETSPITLPNNLNVGTYYILVLADAENELSETNENNNIGCIEFNIVSTDTNYQDVTLSNPYVVSTEANIGDAVPISIYQNYTGYQTEDEIGGIAVHYYLSTDCELSSDDHYFNDDNSFIGNDDSSDKETYTMIIPDSISTGQYYVLFVADATDIVTENNENNNLECIPITINDDTLGINDNEFNNQIKIYPNPVSDVLTINLGQTYSKINLEIFNVLGQKVNSFEFEQKQKLTINTGSLSNGIYFFKIKTDKIKLVNFKIIKE